MTNSAAILTALRGPIGGVLEVGVSAGVQPSGAWKLDSTARKRLKPEHQRPSPLTNSAAILTALRGRIGGVLEVGVSAGVQPSGAWKLDSTARKRLKPEHQRPSPLTNSAAILTALRGPIGGVLEVGVSAGVQPSGAWKLDSTARKRLKPEHQRPSPLTNSAAILTALRGRIGGVLEVGVSAGVQPSGAWKLESTARKRLKPEHQRPSPLTNSAAILTALRGRIGGVLEVGVSAGVQPSGAWKLESTARKRLKPEHQRPSPLTNSAAILTALRGRIGGVLEVGVSAGVQPSGAWKLESTARKRLKPEHQRTSPLTNSAAILTALRGRIGGVLEVGVSAGVQPSGAWKLDSTARKRLKPEHQRPSPLTNSAAILTALRGRIGGVLEVGVSAGVQPSGAWKLDSNA